MRDFLLTATDREGRRTTHHVKALSSQEAYEQLEGKDYTDIVLHTDDAGAAVNRLTAFDGGHISPAEMIVLRGVSPLGFFLFLARKLYIHFRLLEILAVVTLALKWWYSDRLGAFGAAALSILVSPVLIALWSTLFGLSRKYDLLLACYAWGRWNDVLARAPALRGHVPDLELSAREAGALAGLGRLEEAIARLEHADSPETPRWMYLARLAEVYEVAGMHERALEIHARAHDDAPDNPTVQLEYAMALLKNERDPALARQLIDAAKKQHLSDILGFFLPMIEGLWLSNTGNASAAVSEFELTRRNLRPLARRSPLAGLMLDLNQAYLAIALARSGEMERAIVEAKPARIRASALNATRMLERLERALGQ
jgi:tetratricopeptide (TPR) repeat protein